MVAHRLFYLGLMATISFAISGCSKQQGCTDFSSPNYNPDALVDDGSCIPMNQKFLGTWDVQSDCSDVGYYRSITPHQDKFGVSVTNLGRNLGAVSARISEDNITIPSQSVSAFIVIEGAGVMLSNGFMRLSYRVRDSSSGQVVIYDCMDEMSKIQ